MPRLVVFDLAGTTMQDDGFVASVFERVLVAEGLDVSAEAVSQVRGASKREAFLQLAGDPARASRLFDLFISSIHDHYATSPPKEVIGASLIFQWLRDQGVKLALNTGFERATVDTLMEALHWKQELFDTIVCGDEVSAGRPHPAMILEAMRRTGVTDPSTVMVVGDTVLDLQAGMAAGVGWILGVTSGAHDHARLLKAPHTQLIASVADIRELLR